jgi:hypothetical protein
MRRLPLIPLVILLIGWGSAAAAVCSRTFPLFKIERSKNKNVVRYDLCISDNGDTPDANPVKAYWILENGRTKDLNAIQSKFAYGIKSQEKVGEDRFTIVLVAFEERKITIEKVEDNFRAIISISGKDSILDKIYVKSEEGAFGLPKVNYIDLFGRILQTNASVEERIVPQ